MGYYEKHVFVCTNQKLAGKPCCAAAGGANAFDYIKSTLMDKNLHGIGKIRVSKSGCLGRCSSGPCLVVYPEGAWYRYNGQDDLDAIVANHIEQGEVVPSLLIDSV